MTANTESLSDFLRESTFLVDTALENLLPASEVEPCRLHAAVRWSVFAGGKRFRPALVLATGKIFGAKSEKLLRTAAAIEMIHTYSLIHDDLPAMDDDDLRRGRETCHVKFDQATAILAGDTLQNLAFLTIAEDENLSSEVRLRLIAEIAKASGTPNGMVAGQQMDLQAEGREKRVSVPELEMIHNYKTGAVISASARAGAIIAGADQADIEKVSKFAESVGLLFQIVDDILDVTQTTEMLGKTAGKDITAEKATYPAICGLGNTKKLAKAIYEKACRELRIPGRDINLLLEIAEFIYCRKK